jgi:hypothetical protein
VPLALEQPLASSLREAKVLDGAIAEKRLGFEVAFSATAANDLDKTRSRLVEMAVESVHEKVPTLEPLEHFNGSQLGSGTEGSNQPFTFRVPFSDELLQGVYLGLGLNLWVRHAFSAAKLVPSCVDHAASELVELKARVLPTLGTSAKTRCRECMRSCLAVLGLVAVGCTPAMIPHVSRALVELAAAMPMASEDGEDAELGARPCYRRVLVALLPARMAGATSPDDGSETVTLLPVVAREVRTACAPIVAGPH